MPSGGNLSNLGAVVISGVRWAAARVLRTGSRTAGQLVSRLGPSAGRDGEVYLELPGRDDLVFPPSAFACGACVMER